MSEPFRKESRKDWHTTAVTLSNDQLKLGSLQRIADAVELMARSHATLISERDLYKRWHEEERAKTHRLRRVNAGLRGHIKRMKRAAP